jgi:hypothetical protein
VLSSVTDVLIASILAIGGIAMTPLPAVTVAAAFVSAVAFAVVLAAAKIPIFAHLRITWSLTLPASRFVRTCTAPYRPPPGLSAPWIQAPCVPYPKALETASRSMIFFDRSPGPPLQQGVAIMPTIRKHYFLPPRSWRRHALPCHGAARGITLGHFVPRAQSAVSTRAELHLVPELNCDGIVTASCLNPHGSKKC